MLKLSDNSDRLRHHLETRHSSHYLLYLRAWKWQFNIPGLSRVIVDAVWTEIVESQPLEALS